MQKKICRDAAKGSLLATTSRISMRLYLAVGVGALGLAALPEQANALNLYDGANSGNNLEINLTTTIEYSVFERVNNPSAVLTSPSNANGSEGDLNFQHGVVANEIEALPVLDVKDGNYGMHVSGEFYLNTPYLSPNQNDQPSTLNPFSVAKNTDFTSATRNVNGENARLLDAFAFGRQTFGNDQTISLKVGRQTLLWGQSLFLTSDSIAGGQAPVDIITAQSLPNAQAQQVFLPVGQAVVTYQPLSNLTIQAYYQFEWQHDNFQGVGAYFNTSDIFDKGGQRLILGPGAFAFRTNDLNPPSQNGQFGVSVQALVGKYDLGIYALRFDSKTPEFYVFSGKNAGPTPNGNQVGTYTVVYPRDIAIYGASVSTNIGAANVAGEVSGRTNQPLDSGLLFQTPANPGNAGSDPLYAVGDTIQGQASMIYVSPAIPFDPGGVSFDGEVELNHVVAVTRNRAALTPGRQATAGTSEFVVTPTYDEVLPNLDITFPIGIAYNFLGRSEMDTSMNHGTGTFNIGVTATYNVTWIAGLTYFDYLGKADPTLNADADRGYVEFNIQHTF
jgi:hypothetical protein